MRSALLKGRKLGHGGLLGQPSPEGRLQWSPLKHPQRAVLWDQWELNNQGLFHCSGWGRPDCSV